MLQDSGQFAAAEKLIREATQDRRHDRTASLLLLVPMYSELGRSDEARQLIEDQWDHLNARGEGGLEPAIKLLRQHIELTWKPSPVETVRAALDQAARLAPKDDRVWLGQANMAIQTGAYDEAGRLLDACEQSRPDDVPILPRLSWGIATDRPEVVQRAMARLQSADVTPVQLHQIRAWLAAKQRNVDTERCELEILLEADPANLAALDRLAQLAERAGRPDRASELRQKNSGNQPASSPVRATSRTETAHSRCGGTGQPGRASRPRFEARGFLTLAISDDPNRKDLRNDLERLSQSRTATTKRRQDEH